MRLAVASCYYPKAAAVPAVDGSAVPLRQVQGHTAVCGYSAYSFLVELDFVVVSKY